MIELGLTKNEARVYLSLLKKGPLTAHEISNASGIYRPSVYDCLNTLMEQGLTSYILVEGKKRFQAANPRSLEDYYEQRLQKVKQVVVELSKFSPKEREVATVEVYRGRKALKKAFRDILVELKRTRVPHLGMGIDDSYFINEDPYFSEWFIRNLEKQNLKEKMITFEGATGFAGGKTTEYRFIPPEFFNPTNILIDGNLVTIIIWTEPRYVIKIRSKQISESYRKQFELMWRGGKKMKWTQSFRQRVPLKNA
ncbi:helix-turn-helix domain-containing protein [Candidatus Micrarchaeota archaeon]|nr:helix-turn-helix domain-containing protein [Candidatus Micrarchaeota archaeon]